MEADGGQQGSIVILGEKQSQGRENEQSNAEGLNP